MGHKKGNTCVHLSELFSLPLKNLEEFFTDAMRVLCDSFLPRITVRCFMFQAGFTVLLSLVISLNWQAHPDLTCQPVRQRCRLLCCLRGAREDDDDGEAQFHRQQRRRQPSGEKVKRLPNTHRHTLYDEYDLRGQ